MEFSLTILILSTFSSHFGTDTISAAAATGIGEQHQQLLHRLLAIDILNDTGFFNIGRRNSLKVMQDWLVFGRGDTFVGPKGFVSRGKIDSTSQVKRQLHVFACDLLLAAVQKNFAETHGARTLMPEVVKDAVDAALEVLVEGTKLAKTTVQPKLEKCCCTYIETQLPHFEKH
jgi:hypothetical protein